MINAYLVPALAIAALTTVLAVVILLAERFLMDFGEVEVTINRDKMLKVKGGKTLLNTLKEEKIFIPSACGGRATCAYCKVKAISGFPELLPTEAPLLTKEEIENGIRLSCQLKVKRDVEIEIPDELFSIREFHARLEKVSDLTYDIKWFRFNLLEPEAIDYKPGQYIQFQSPPYGDVSESVYRAYSLCGLWTEKDCIELMVRLVPEGVCTTYLFKYLKTGQDVTFTGPFGEFYLRDTDRKMICIAGGSGMAPIRAILLAMSPEQIAKREPVFFFGARSTKDLFMEEEWREFERSHPGFRFIPALSRPDPDDQWTGDTGRVTDVVPVYFDDISNHEAYLCGSPGMLDSCIEMLTRMGMPEDRIYYDKFT